MNQIYLHSTPEGIKLIEGDKMPYPLYNEALKRLIAESIPVQNKEVATAIIARNGSLEVPHLSLQEGSIYGPFTVGYEIDDRCGQHLFNSTFCGDCQPGGCKQPVRVAILYDDTPEKPEDDFTTLVKLINSYEAGMSEYFRMHDYRNMYGLWEQLIKKANGIKIGR